MRSREEARRSLANDGRASHAALTVLDRPTGRARPMGSTSLAEELCFSELTSQRRCVSEATPPHRIVHVNAAWCECTGYTREEALQQTPMVLTGPETCPQTLQARVAPLAQPSPPTDPFERSRIPANGWLPPPLSPARICRRCVRPLRRRVPS